MALGQNRTLKEGLADVWAKLKPNMWQFFIAWLLVMMCGAVKKLSTFPMPYIAGQSQCMKEVTSVPENMSANSAFLSGGKSYEPQVWIETKPDCEEKARVFTFVTEKFTATTANLVFFGVSKAVLNFVTGVFADVFGRKWCVVLGWLCFIPMPLMVIFATDWWTVATSNIFLGIQQSLVWSATIFIMIDYLGTKNAGIAIGINETTGYVAVAVFNSVAGALIDTSDPRAVCYYVTIGITVVGILVSGILLKESKNQSVTEEAERTGRSEDAIAKPTDSTLTWPSGRESKVDVARSAFLYTSFVNHSTLSICFAGLLINFLSGFAWGLLVKWMKGGGSNLAGEWQGLDVISVSNVLLAYGLFKGVPQFFFGFLGDRYGRKWFIVGGLSTCFLGLIIMIGAGVNSADPTAGFAFGSIFLGLGTSIMYTNNLAAICDHSDPSWRSSALGTYRFWRDMGYAVGALVTGAIADWVGIPWSVAFAAILTFISAVLVALLYQEVLPVDDELPTKGADLVYYSQPPAYIYPAMDQMRPMGFSSVPMAPQQQQQMMMQLPSFAMPPAVPIMAPPATIA